ncbi:hypothetical protein RZS08_18450, partial [Arthrospira platensis SPKY1]|nr:hypothetical protein [Arthrospira platensis SPKY1]
MADPSRRGAGAPLDAVLGCAAMSHEPLVELLAAERETSAALRAQLASMTQQLARLTEQVAELTV